YDLADLVPGAVRGPRPRQDQISDVRSERIRHGTAYRVVALARILDHHVACAVHDVRVVARATGHRVASSGAVNYVRSAIADERIGQGVADAVDVGRSGQHEPLDIGRERIADRALDRVGAFAGVFDDLVAGAVDEIRVVPARARHGVGTEATVERVIARAA